MTPQQKSRFFGQHLGCKCFYGSIDFETKDILIGIDMLESIVSTDYGIDRVEHSDNNFKLILRPLSSLTDAEAIECAKILFDDVRADGEWLQDKIGNNELMNTWAYFDRAVNAIDYLRSLNFVLPFQGIDPIEAGVAVLETSEIK